MSDDELDAIRDRELEDLEMDVDGDGEAGDAPTATASTAPDEPIHVDSVEEFSAVTTDYDVTLVDFYADWCGPCKMLEPVVASVARNTHAAVAKVDIDEQEGLAAQYGVRSVPTMVVFADGEQVEQLVGMQDEERLTRLVDRHA